MCVCVCVCECVLIFVSMCVYMYIYTFYKLSNNIHIHNTIHMYIVGELDYLDGPGVLYTNLKLSDPVLAGEHDNFFCSQNLAEGNLTGNKGVGWLNSWFPLHFFSYLFSPWVNEHSRLCWGTYENGAQRKQPLERFAPSLNDGITMVRVDTIRRKPKAINIGHHLTHVFLVVHPTNRKWVSSPWWFQWDKWGQVVHL